MLKIKKKIHIFINLKAEIRNYF